MEYPTGIFVFLLAILGYWYSWNRMKNQKALIALSFLVLIGLILRVYLSSDFYLHFWDERYHALVAKNMIDHPLVPTLYDNPIFDYSYTDWSGNHIWLHKQPLALWSMSFSMSVFGVNELALRLPSILLSTLGIVINYRIAKLLFNTRTAFISAFLFSINGLIIELASGRVTADHIDVAYMFYIQLGVLMALEFARRKSFIFNLLCGVCIGLAILTKWLPALIVLPVWFFALLHYRTFGIRKILMHFILLSFTIALIALPWQIYIRSEFTPEALWEAEYNMKHLTIALEGQSAPFYYYIVKIRLIFGELAILALLFLGWSVYRKPRNYKYWLLAVWIIIPLVFFSFAATKMQGYILIIAPAIFIVTSYFWSYLKMNLKRYKYKWMVVVILIALLLFPVRYSIERLKPFDSTDRSKIWVDEYKVLGSETRNVEGVIFNTLYPIEVMFYTDLTAYERLPEPYIIDSLVNEGYTVYVNENATTLPSVYKSSKCILINIDENSE